VNTASRAASRQRLAQGIADRLGVRTEVDRELQEIKQDVAPTAVLDEIETKDDDLSKAAAPE
jgi:hypothetical protein